MGKKISCIVGMFIVFIHGCGGGAPLQSLTGVASPQPTIESPVPQTIVETLATPLAVSVRRRSFWQNPENPFDVDRDGVIEQQDAQDIMDYINNPEFGTQADGTIPLTKDYDTNGDNTVAPLDALAIINYLNDPNHTLVLPAISIKVNFVDNSADENAFVVEYASNANGPWARTSFPANVGTGPVSVNLDQIPAGSIYLRVIAVKAALSSTPSSVMVLH